MIQPFYLIFADFLTSGGGPDPVRISTLPNNLSWNGFTWLGGLSDLLEVSEISETTDGAAEKISLRVDAIPTDFFDPITETQYQGRAMHLYFGLLDESGAVIPDPYLLFKGQMDADQITDDGTLSVMTVSAVSELSNQLKAKTYRYSHNDQQLLNPNDGDQGLEFAAQLQDVKLKWGTL